MNRQKFNSYIKNQDFIELFIDMGWNNGSPADRVFIKHDDDTFKMDCIAQKSGFKVFVCDVENIPLMTVIRDLDKRLRKSANDYILILVSTSEAIHHEWIVPVKSLEKRVLVPVEYINENQLDFLFSKLDDLSFGLTEKISILDVTKRVSGAFVQNSEKVTKDFYSGFRKQHNIFAGFVSGIDLEKDKQWYVSVMLNRLMFCYFIQKKGFLNFDTNYLQTKLKECSRKKGHDTFYKGFYKSFLTVLFHDGLNNPKHEDRAFIEKFGHIPYLNGGLFDDHYVEREYPDIDIKDEAFENLFEFFDKYHWHLDTRIEASGKDINPDVIGYIFEQYINDRAQMGAYYTKEDITNYIGKNCILPFLWNKVEKNAGVDDAWDVLKSSGNKYIYDSVKKGIYDEGGNITNIPENIAIGLDTESPDLIERRKEWNSKTPEQFGLPTEIWRETIERRNRCFDVLKRIESGKIQSINDFITYNLDIIAFTQDFLQETDDERFISSFYHSMLELSVLDPTCGSGAFLFAAMNILEPLYDICIDRMEEINKIDSSLFNQELSEINGRYRSNRPYFIYKTIILRNLYGVDIMPEAIEIAKLRLFLKMVAVVEADRRAPNLGLDPLPDIDFNIRCGNTLVGFVNQKELFGDFEGTNADMFAVAEWEGVIRDKVAIIANTYIRFRELQLQQTEEPAEFKMAKKKLQSDLMILNDMLNRYLYKKTASSEKSYEEWIDVTHPFHWFSEFYDIMSGHGGFDVIIGNPPYLEKRQIDYEVIGYETIDSGAVHAWCMERSLHLVKKTGFLSMIVPLAIVCTQRMVSLQRLLEDEHNVWYSNYAWRPAKLFDAVNRALTIVVVGTSSEKCRHYSTGYRKWISENRVSLFESLAYVNYEEKRDSFWMPKISAQIEKEILSKVLRCKDSIPYHFDNTPYYVFYRTTGGLYWKIFTDFPPKFYFNGVEGKSSRQTHFSVSSERQAVNCVGLLSSNLFWWWYTLTANLRDLNPSDIAGFKIPVGIIDSTDLYAVSKDYIRDIVENSTMLTREQSGKGTTQTQSFKVSLSKCCINEIDRIMAKSYGFTEEEYDYIVNYDIKYRMGDEIDSQE